MRKKRRLKALKILFSVTVVALFSGCAGSGGGVTSGGSPRYGHARIQMNLKMPPGAQRTAGQSSLTYAADIMVTEYDANATPTVQASTVSLITYNSSTTEYTGRFSIIQIPVDDNYICKAEVHFEEGGQPAGMVIVRGGALVSISNGVTSTVIVDGESTVEAAAALRYAQLQSTPVALNNTSVITSTVKSKISTAVDSLVATGTLSSLVISSYFTDGATGDPFDVKGWATNTTLTSLLDSVLTEAGLTGISAPSYVYDGLSADVDTQTSTTELSANWASVSNASAYYYAAGTTSGATDTFDWTSTTGTSATKTGLTLTASTTYYFSVKAKNSTGEYSSVKTSDGVTVSSSDTTAPYVSKFMIDSASIATSTTSATNVSYDGTAFKVVFNESMDTSITPSGYSIALQNATTASTLTINSSNSASYGTLAWGTTTNTDDTLIFTLKPNATLLANSLKVLVPKTTYNITSWTAPTNLKDAAGNALSTTGIVTTGSFTTIGLQASSFSPVSGATGVEYDATVFKVIFNQTMDSSINLNTQSTLTASGFSVSLQSQYGGTLTINAQNALNYGDFAWTTTTKTNDTLSFTLLPSATLTLNQLKTLQPNTTYNITSRTVPTNLTDLSGNAVDTSTNIASTGSFTTKQ